jgi:hypothetical protein
VEAHNLPVVAVFDEGEVNGCIAFLKGSFGVVVGGDISCVPYSLLSFNTEV